MYLCIHVVAHMIGLLWNVYMTNIKHKTYSMYRTNLKPKTYSMYLCIYVVAHMLGFCGMSTRQTLNLNYAYICIYAHAHLFWFALNVHGKPKT